LGETENILMSDPTIIQPNRKSPKMQHQQNHSICCSEKKKRRKEKED
jgi:hypothetical protein